jgi:preprotein translocase subunit SecF
MEMKFIELVKSGTAHDFVKYRRIAVTASLIVNVAILVGATVWPGLNYGVDFAGGSELQVKFKVPVEAGAVREEVGKLGFGEPTVQQFGAVENHEFLVRVERISLLSKEKAEAVKAEVQGDLAASQPTTFHFDPETGDKLDLGFKQVVDLGVLKKAAEKAGLNVKDIRAMSAREGQDREYTIIAQGPGDKIGSSLREKFGQDSVEIVRTEYVGPQVGKQLRKDGIAAVVYAMLMILVYVGFRFDFRFAPGVIISLLHDAVVTLGFFVVTRREFNLTSVTVILTVVGYSVNDTIVVYDRIRENAKRFKGKGLKDLVNLSINEMLGRTILTSGATALSLVGLIVIGVGTIQDFALAMLVGIISGTYSTWYIASPMTIWLEEYLEHRKQVDAARPKPNKGGGKSGQTKAPATAG